MLFRKCPLLQQCGCDFLFLYILYSISVGLYSGFSTPAAPKQSLKGIRLYLANPSPFLLPYSTFSTSCITTIHIFLFVNGQIYTFERHVQYSILMVLQYTEQIATIFRFILCLAVRPQHQHNGRCLFWFSVNTRWQCRRIGWLSWVSMSETRGVM